MGIGKGECFIVPGVEGVFESGSEEAEFEFVAAVVDEFFDEDVEAGVIEEHGYRGG